jgi:hypothetical protein
MKAGGRFFPSTTRKYTKRRRGEDEKLHRKEKSFS